MDDSLEMDGPLDWSVYDDNDDGSKAQRSELQLASLGADNQLLSGETRSEFVRPATDV